MRDPNEQLFGNLEICEQIFEDEFRVLNVARTMADCPPLTPEHKIAVSEALKDALETYVIEEELYEVVKLFNPDESPPDKGKIFDAVIKAMEAVDCKRGIKR